jgi:hypothetical protein
MPFYAIHGGCLLVLPFPSKLANITTIVHPTLSGMDNGVESIVTITFLSTTADKIRSMKDEVRKDKWR